MNKTKYIALCAIALLSASCGDFLEETSQDTDYVRTWHDLDELLIGDCYMSVYGTSSFTGSGNYGSGLHLITDEVEEINSDGYTQDFDNHEREFGLYTWQQRTGQNEAYTDFFTENRDWTKAYKCINVANNVLNSVTKLPQQTDSDIRGAAKVTGEAHFLRAFYYFWLVNMYGQPYNPSTAQTDLGVPLKTSEEVLDIKYSRNSVQEVYDLVLADLTAAEKELTTYGAKQKSIYRADSVAVQLLLSRVYLYMQNWEKAAEYARKVISVRPELEVLSSAGSKFSRKSNPEMIFSMGGDDVPRMLYHAIKGLTVSQSLYNSYSGYDLRRRQWYWSYGLFHGLTKQPEGERYTNLDRTDKSYYYYAYNEGRSGDQAPVSSLFLLRSAEAYANLAEAEAYMGNDDDARETLLTLMKARYEVGALELNIGNLTGNSLIDFIREERRREFPLEGHRWFDLRRYRVCTVNPKKTSITHDYTYYESRNSTRITEVHRFVLGEEDASWTLPIPQEVINFNTGMPNNGNQWREYTVITH